MRNRARNRKEQEKEAERNFTFYAEGGPKDVFVGLPQEYKSPAAERLKANLLKTKPLCHQDPCNDPACRLDHEGREIQVFDGDLSRYWER